MRVELVRIHKNLGTTTIYVTHDQTEAMTMATKIVLMNDGKIQQFGTPMELYNMPANVFVAGFIGVPQMNFYDARLVRDGDAYAVELDGISVPVSAEKCARLAARGVSSQDITLDRDFDLIARCGDGGGGYRLTSVNLNDCLTNEFGNLRWKRGGNFGGSARNVRLADGGRVLECELADGGGGWRHGYVHLDERIGNEGGELRFLD